MFEYLKNLTFQALSQENDDAYMSFKEIGLLVNDLLECFIKKENEQIDKSSILGKQIRRKLETDFKVELSSELKTQRVEEEIEPEINDPTESSTPVKTEQIEEIYNQEKEDFLKTALTISKTDLETAVAMAESDLDTTFRLSNTLQERLHNILMQARKKSILLNFQVKQLMK